MAKTKITRRVTKLKELTHEFVRQALSYDERTGEFRWKWRPDAPKRTNTRFYGKIAGGVSVVSGYRLIGINGIRVYAHRLAIFYVSGKWPEFLCDHRNGRRDDNRKKNIRSATFTHNSQNSRKPSTNKSGYKGVSFCKIMNLWTANINHNRKRRNLGYFSSPKKAHTAYCEAANRLHRDFACHD